MAHVSSFEMCSLLLEELFMTEFGFTAADVLLCKVKVKISHNLIAEGAVGVGVPLYLGHS